eukprot:7384418-Prymnesium_polylepis.2
MSPPAALDAGKDALVAYFGPQKGHSQVMERWIPSLKLLRMDLFEPGYVSADGMWTKDSPYDRSTVRADVQGVTWVGFGLCWSDSSQLSLTRSLTDAPRLCRDRHPAPSRRT